MLLSSAARCWWSLAPFCSALYESQYLTPRKHSPLHWHSQSRLFPLGWICIPYKGEGFLFSLFWWRGSSLNFPHTSLSATLNLLMFSLTKLHTFLSFLSFIIYFMCIGVLFTCMSVHYMCVWCRWRPGKGTRSPRLELLVVVNYLPHGCWEWNLGSLEEPPILLTAVSLSSPQTVHF